MTPKTEALARSLVDLPAWRWLPGMLTTRYGRIDTYESLDLASGQVNRDLRVLEPIFEDWLPLPTDAIPDLDDPLTAAGLGVVVRLAWGESAHLVRLPTHEQLSPGADLTPALWWAVAVGLASVPLLVYRADGSRHYLAGATQEEALAAALLAAPKKDSDAR